MLFRSDSLSTSVPGIFACGNVLHVHDLADFVTLEAEAAGKAAARFIAAGDEPHRSTVNGQGLKIIDGEGVRGVTPQFVGAQNFTPDSASDESIVFSFRPTGVYRNATLIAELDGVEVFRKKALIFTPGEMQRIKIRRKLFSEGKQLKLKIVV